MALRKLGGGQTCCVPGCDNNTLRDRHVSFHKFPKDEKLKKEWIRRINRQGHDGRFALWKPSEHHRICGAHFNASGRKSYMDRLPSIFPHRVYSERCPPVETAAAKRTKRLPANASVPLPCIQDELVICSTVEISLPGQRNDPVCLTPPTSCSPLPAAFEEQGFYCADHMYSVGPQENATTTIRKKMDVLLELCTRLQDENANLKAENSAVKAENSALKAELCELKIEMLKNKATSNKENVSMADFLSADEERLQFYTGFCSHERLVTFIELVESKYKPIKSNGGRPPALSMREQIIVVLCRLRVGLLEQDLSYRFGVSVSTISAMCVYWVNFLHEMFVQIPIWPARRTIDMFMPESFRTWDSSTRVVVDCTEIFIEMPSDYNTQSETYSLYKGHNTAKGLIGITPNGFVSFVSNLAPGWLSDKEITKHSGLYKLLEQGDSVMADRGFLIEDDLRELGVKLNRPPMLNGRRQLTVAEETRTRQIANLRIHVERVIREVKNFRILRYVFPNVMADKLNQIWKICCYLNNFTHEPLLNR